MKYSIIDKDYTYILIINDNNALLIDVFKNYKTPLYQGFFEFAIQNNKICWDIITYKSAFINKDFIPDHIKQTCEKFLKLKEFW